MSSPLLSLPVRRGALSLAGLWILLLALSVDAVAQEEPWITLRGGDEYELLADSARVTVPVPVTLATGVAASAVRIRLIQVRQDKRTDARLMRAFSHLPNLVDLPTRGPFLPITVDLATVTTPGTYELLFEASRGTGPPIDLALKIIHPAPALESVATHRLMRTRGLLGRLDVQGTRLRLRETSGDAWLTGVAIQPREFADETKRPVDVETLSLRGMPLAIPPDSTLQATLDVAGDFPLGKTTGTAVLYADQLASPVVVNVEVETRRAPALIFLIIAVGLLVGFVMRTTVQRLVELSEARLKGFDLDQRLIRALQRHPDADFDEDLRPTLTSLREKLQATSVLKAIFLDAKQAQELTDAITKADEALQTALTNLGTRRTAAQTRIAEVASVTKTRLRLPRLIAHVLQEAHPRTEEALQSLQAGKIRQAREQADAVHQHLAAALEGPVRDWKFSVDLKDRLLPDQMPLPAYVTDNLKEAITDFDTLLKAVSLPTPDTSVADLKTMLAAVHTAHTNLFDLMRYLSRWVRVARDETVAPLRQVKELLPDPGAVQKLIEDVDDFLKDVAALIEDDRLEDLIELLEGRALEPLEDAWRASLQRQSGAVEQWIKQRKYIEAAQAIAASLVSTPEDTLLGDEDKDRHVPVPPGVTGRSDARWLPHINGAPGAEAAVFLMQGEDRPDRVRVDRLSTFRQLVVSKIGRWLVAGIGIAVVGFLLFDETFVGTFDEIAGIFFWAFGLDVTVDAFWEQGKKLIPST